MQRFMPLAAGLTALLVSPGCLPERSAEASPPKEIWRERDLNKAVTGAGVPTQNTLAPLIKTLKPAVVNIATTTVVKGTHRRGARGRPADPFDQFFEQFGGGREMPESRGSSLGSGFIINQEGYILTNNHVVKDATDIRVHLSDNREFTAKVVGKDPLTDVAVIRLQNPPKNLPTAMLGDSDKAEQGDFVIAMGSPFGYRESASFGIVSAKDRTLSGGAYDDFIQTDAAINPGNSGGPLFNLQGDVIGINTAIVNPQIGQGVGFAIPINLAKGLIPQLISSGKVARGYLGVSVSGLTPDLAQAFGLPQNAQGAVVQQVMPKSPAMKAGLVAGDLVVSLNGKPIQSSGELTRSVALIPPGGKANLTVLRNGTRKELSVTVAQRPENEEALNRGEIEGDEGGQDEGAGDHKEMKLGVKLQALTPNLARELGIRGENGVVVMDVAADSPAERAGIRKGDLIMEVNRQPVTAPSQIGKHLAKAKPGDLLLLRIRRGNNAMYLALRLDAK